MSILAGRGSFPSVRGKEAPPARGHRSARLLIFGRPYAYPSLSGNVRKMGKGLAPAGPAERGGAKTKRREKSGKISRKTWPKAVGRAEKTERRFGALVERTPQISQKNRTIAPEGNVIFSFTTPPKSYIMILKVIVEKYPFGGMDHQRSVPP